MPRIQMTRTVKIALYFLLAYLLTMMLLIVIKFVRIYHAPRPSATHPTSQTAAATPSAAQPGAPISP